MGRGSGDTAESILYGLTPAREKVSANGHSPPAPKAAEKPHFSVYSEIDEFVKNAEAQCVSRFEPDSLRVPWEIVTHPSIKLGNLDRSQVDLARAVLRQRYDTEGDDYYYEEEVEESASECKVIINRVDQEGSPQKFEFVFVA